MKTFKVLSLLFAAALLSGAVQGEDPSPKLFPRLIPVAAAPSSALPPFDNPLTADSVYPLTFDNEVMLRAFPEGVVTLVKEPGPDLRVRARFADTGKMETRTLKGKTIALVEPVTSGTVTIVAVPVGAKTESEWMVQSLTVKMSTGPPVPVDTFLTDLKAAYAAETETDKADSVSKLSKLYLAAAASMVDDPTIRNLAEFTKELKGISEKTLDPTKIQKVRKVVGARLNPNFGDLTKEMDRPLLKAELNAVGKGLDSLLTPKKP